LYITASINVRLVTGIFLLSLLSACASTPQTLQLKSHPPEQIQPQAELTSVAFFPQRQYQCGPAALATILDHSDIKITPDELTGKVYIPQRKGSLQLDMIATARSYGLLSYKLAPKLSALLNEINNGNPVLVFQNLSLAIWPQWHYAVAVGYNLSTAELILRSGAIRQHSVSFSTFERTWQRAKHWSYVVIKPGEIPFTANPIDYTQASQDLQSSGFPRQALKAFRAGAKRWPDNSITLMALGNSEYAAGNYDKALLAFYSELNQRKTNASAWNNLAYVLAAKNCKDQALQAVNCAMSLSPSDKNIEQSLLEIHQSSVSDTGSCENITCPTH